MNVAQRTILVIALGLVVTVAVGVVNHRLAQVDGGWLGTSPSGGVLYSGPGPGGSPWPRALTCLAGIAVWAGGSLLIFRRSAPPAPEG